MEEKERDDNWRDREREHRDWRERKNERDYYIPPSHDRPKP